MKLSPACVFTGHSILLLPVLGLAGQLFSQPCVGRRYVVYGMGGEQEQEEKDSLRSEAPSPQLHFKHPMQGLC